MNRRWFVWISVFILLAPAAFALNSNDVIFHWTMDDDDIDGSNIEEVLDRHDCAIGASLNTGGAGATSNTGESFEYLGTGGGAGHETQCLNNLDPDTLDYMTYCFWIRADATDSNDHFIGWTPEDGANGQVFFKRDGARLKYKFGDGSNGAFNSGWDFTANEWVHACFAYNETTPGSTAEIKMYINGTEIITDTRGDKINAQNDLYIGGRDDGSNFNWDGDIDQVTIWNTTLGPTEIADLWNSGDGLAYPFATTPPTPDNLTITAQTGGTPLSDFNASVQFEGSYQYYDPSGLQINTSVVSNATQFVNVTVELYGYVPITISNWNTSNATLEVTLSPYFRVNVTDFNDGHALQTFNVSVNGDTWGTTSGDVMTNINTSDALIKNITVWAPNYLNRTFVGVNTSTHYTASLWQTLINFTAYNTIAQAYLNTFNVTWNGIWWNATTGSVLVPMNSSNFTFTAYSPESEGTSFTLETLAGQLNPYMINFTPIRTFYIYDEMTLGPFDTSAHNQTRLTIVCPDESEFSHTFSAGSANMTIGVPCRWSFIKIDVQDETEGTYFRTSIPDFDLDNYSFYMANLHTDTVVQNVLALNDLVGTYGDGSVIIRKYINGTSVEIMEQLWDVETKVTLYLVKLEGYTLVLKDENGDERNLGYFFAETAAEKTITVPEIEFVPQTTLGSAANWSWERDIDREFVKFYYQDTGSKTLNLTFTVYNGSNPAQVLYSTTSFNLGSATFSYVTDNTTTYLVCFAGYHSTEGPIDSCKAYAGYSDLGFWEGWPENDKAKLLNWFSGFILFVIILISSFAHIGGGLIATAALGTLLTRVGWWTVGTPFQRYALFVVIGMLGALLFWLEETRK